MTTVAEQPTSQRAVPPARWCLGTRLLVTATLAWAALLLVHALVSGRWWLWLVVELAPPVVVLVVPVVLLALTPLAARPVRLPLAVVLAATLVLGVPLSGLSLPAAAGAAPGAVKVFSWNTGYWHQGEDPAAFYSYLRAQHADVYLLQEYLYFSDDPIRIDDLPRIRREFPGYHVAAASELVTISRLPIAASRPVDASALMSPADGSAPPAGTGWRDYYTTKALRTDIRVGGDLVSFYNVHLAVQVDIRLSPFSPAFYRVIHDQYHRREAELRTLSADLSANGNPAVIAGDFNSTSLMADVRRLCERSRCHDPSGPSPLPLSWPTEGMPRLWRLDWVLSQGGLDVTGYHFTPSKGMSDHLAQSLSVSVAR
ncbi:endonuclease/exonuclease/phosphatase family protein [Sphaerisporangium sp. NBC_01403]|uniref:endonuclease/exonuclease/phosphatase family protein n=1 Tax=Sphaerisporangium sp. NBC_01403 TaxID=2903599 RepID=UPI00324DA92E